MNFNPDNCYISLSRKATPKIAEALDAPHDTDEEVRRIKNVVAGATCDAVKDEDSVEIHFVARVNLLNGTAPKPLMLNCIVTQGSPSNAQPYTLIVRGAMQLTRYEEIIAQWPKAKGCMAFEIDGQHIKPFFNKARHKAAQKHHLRSK